MAPDGIQPEINQSLDPAPKAEEVMSNAYAALVEHSDKPAMSLVTPADKAKPAEVPKAPEAPKPTEPAKPAEAPKVPEAPKAPEVTADNPEGLPKNEWADSYYALKKQLEDYPEMNGPLMAFALQALRLAAKYAKYADMVPGVFAKSVADSDVSIEKEKAEKLAEAHLKQKTKEEKDKIEADVKKSLIELEAAEKLAKRTFGAEKASIKFATRTLWNNDDFEDAKTLSASLLNTSKFGEPLYKQKTPEEISQLKPIPEGTLIVFIPNMKSAEKIVAYATGFEDEFKYYDVENPANPIQTFRFNDKDSIIKKTGVQTLMILAPNVQSYKDAKETLSNEGIEAKANQAIAKLKADNESTTKDIAENKSNPDKDKLAVIKATALKNFTEADASYKAMLEESNSEEYNVKTLEEAEKVAKAKSEAPVSTDKDKADYAEASRKKLEAIKFQDNLPKFKEIRDAAKKNCDDVGVETAKPTEPAAKVEPAAPVIQSAPAPEVQASVPAVVQTPVAAEPSKEAKAAWETVKGWAGSVLNLFKTK